MLGNGGKWFFSIIFLSMIYRIFSRYERITVEMKIMQCICMFHLPRRLDNIRCMEDFVTGSALKVNQAVQYCGYFGDNINIGTEKQDTEQGANTWKYLTPDLYTNKSCKHTKYRPGKYRPPYLRYVTPKGWGLGRCIIDVAEISFETSVYMFKECCAYRKQMKKGHTIV